jgi:hypothetical protein
MKYCSTMMMLMSGLVMTPASLSAQGFGGFGGGGNFSGAESHSSNSAQQRSFQTLQPDVALNYITIEGTADIRVKPEGIRLVLAITSEAVTADLCQQQNAAQIKAVRTAWSKLKVPQENISKISSMSYRFTNGGWTSRKNNRSADKNIQDIGCNRTCTCW